MSSETKDWSAKSEFVVKAGSFVGPLDLLLDLIEKRKLSISEISLAQVAEDYIVYVQKLSEFPIATTAHFILIASTLLLIKSRALLPSLELSEEEQGSIADLERRLRLYKRARELSKIIKEHFGKQIIFPSEQRIQVSVFSPDKKTNLETIPDRAGCHVHDFPWACFATVLSVKQNPVTVACIQSAACPRKAVGMALGASGVRNTLRFQTLAD